MATRREQRRAEWEASGAPEAQARLRAALAAAGVDVPDIRAAVNGTTTSALHATVIVFGDELEALTAALERAALPPADDGTR